MSDGRLGRLIEAAQTDIRDADRCVALGITPPTHQLHRRLREVTDALAAAAVEPEYEYALMDGISVDIWGVVKDIARTLPTMRAITESTGEQIVRRRAPGPWEPVPDTNERGDS